jgi:hypothetical protein
LKPVIRLSTQATVLYAIVALFLNLTISGCTVQLAPSYDKTIIDGLTAANVETLTLFASVSSGVDGSGYAKREVTYNEIIGEFDALRIQALARPTPRPLLAKVFGMGPSENSKPTDIEKLDTAPSIPAMESIIKTITKMRDDDSKGKLNENLVQGFKRSYEISIDQALTYEKALER